MSIGSGVRQPGFVARAGWEWLARVLGVMLLSLAGCGGSGVEGLVPVSGRVLLNGTPLVSGTVSLRTDEGWEQPTGMIGSDGRYTVYTQRRPGAPPGRYKVVVFSAEAPVASGSGAHPELPRSLVPERYRHPETTPLAIVVPATSGSATAFDLELNRDAK